MDQLRKALAQAGVKQETVASPDDHVSASTFLQACMGCLACRSWLMLPVLVDALSR